MKQKAEFEQHISQCPGCTQSLKEFIETTGLIKQVNWKADLKNVPQEVYQDLQLKLDTVYDRKFVTKKPLIWLPRILVPVFCSLLIVILTYQLTLKKEIPVVTDQKLLITDNQKVEPMKYPQRPVIQHTKSGTEPAKTIEIIKLSGQPNQPVLKQHQNG
jgi:hypothetical protein